MNYRMILNVLGKILLVEALLMCLPLIVGFVYNENTWLGFVIPISCLVAAGVPIVVFKPKDSTIYAKEGFVIVALAWLAMSLVGAVPFVVTKSIPNYIDALFETVSGFTTTGSSILTDVEALPNSMLFWRSLTQWIGGMGVLVFVLAVMPDNNSGIMHVFRAETTGPNIGKLVSKMKFTARILYGIYIVLTLVEVVFLVCGKMPVFDSFVHAFATASTGGFGIKSNSVAYYNSTYIEMVIAVFMFIFGINFNIFYLLIIRNFSRVFKNEELQVYFGITVVATILIACDIVSQCANFGQAIRYSFFQVVSIGTSSGFATADFNTWPTFSKGLLLLLMMIGACAGSTGGGMKVARLIILVKSAFADMRKMAKPRTVISVRLDGEAVSEKVIKNVRTFFVISVGLIIVTTLLISIEGSADLLTNLSAAITCLNNIGPGLGLVGPMGNFSGYSAFSKILLSLDMLAGRLELFPILIMFSPATWKRR